MPISTSTQSPRYPATAQASTPPALSSPAAGRRKRTEPRTHLFDALQSVVGLLDMPVHRIHSGRFAGFYPRAMNVVQPVKREESGYHWGRARPTSLTATLPPQHHHAGPSGSWQVPRPFASHGGLRLRQPCAGGVAPAAQPALPHAWHGSPTGREGRRCSWVFSVVANVSTTGR